MDKGSIPLERFGCGLEKYQYKADQMVLTLCFRLSKFIAYTLCKHIVIRQDSYVYTYLSRTVCSLEQCEFKQGQCFLYKTQKQCRKGELYGEFAYTPKLGGYLSSNPPPLNWHSSCVCGCVFIYRPMIRCTPYNCGLVDSPCESQTIDHGGPLNVTGTHGFALIQMDQAVGS